jgi:prolyl 4-hydroxylase
MLNESKDPTKLKQLSNEWVKWIEENLARGCTHESILEKLIENNFDPLFSAYSVYLFLNPSAQTIESIQKKEQTKTEYIYETPRIPQAGNTIKTADRDVHVSLRMSKPVVAVFENLLSSEECDELVKMSQAKLKRSTIINPATGEHQVIEARSSHGTFFSLNENELIAKLDKRIATIMNWPIENGEGIQILNYKIDGEYKPHFDYFPPTDSGSKPHLNKGGQRVSTLIMYLNDVEEAGETVFPKIGLSITPKKGSALYFEYCNGQGQVDPLTLHGGNPVAKGSKWIATKWMRQGRYTG